MCVNVYEKIFPMIIENDILSESNSKKKITKPIPYSILYSLFSVHVPAYQTVPITTASPAVDLGDLRPQIRLVIDLSNGQRYQK